MMFSGQILQADEDLCRFKALFFRLFLVTVIHSFGSNLSRKNVDGSSAGTFNSGDDLPGVALLGKAPKPFTRGVGENANSFAAHLRIFLFSSLLDCLVELKERLLAIQSYLSLDSATGETASSSSDESPERAQKRP
jgi:hypothetical protein